MRKELKPIKERISIMPYISVKTPFKATETQAESVKAKLGKAIEIIPGKTERWLMVSFEKQDYMFFAGKDEPSAMIEVFVFGDVTSSDSEKLTAEICRIISSELSVATDRIYVKYSGISEWGWNGGNF